MFDATGINIENLVSLNFWPFKKQSKIKLTPDQYHVLNVINEHDGMFYLVSKQSGPFLLPRKLLKRKRCFVLTDGKFFESKLEGKMGLMTIIQYLIKIDYVTCDYNQNNDAVYYIAPLGAKHLGEENRCLSNA